MAESDSKSSSDETDRLDQNDEYSGSGRSYECTFCKRGFTTAQALGGHMNIHRKDRGKPRLGTSTADHHHHHHHNPLVYPSKLIDENYASFRSFLAIQSYPPVHFSRSPSAPDHQVHLDYPTYNINPTTTWGRSTFVKPSVQDDHINSQVDNGSNYDLLRENWRGSTLSLGLGVSNHEEEEDHHHDKEKISGGVDHVEVDLELRLGYDP